jgi:hypothetical protein
MRLDRVSSIGVESVRHRDILLYRADVVTTVHMPTGALMVSRPA